MRLKLDTPLCFVPNPEIVCKRIKKKKKKKKKIPSVPVFSTISDLSVCQANNEGVVVAGL